MKRLLTLIVLIFSILSLSSLAHHQYSGHTPYGAGSGSSEYGEYGSGIPYTGQSRLEYQQYGYGTGYGLGSGPYQGIYVPGNYDRYKDLWGPFDFKLKRTIDQDLIKELIENFDGTDIDLIQALVDLNPHDAIDDEYVVDEYINGDQCVSLEAYNTLANLYPFRYDPIDLEHLPSDLDRETVRRFGLEDYQKIANANSYDNIKPINEATVNGIDYEDLQCFTLRDYNKGVASLKAHDKWDVIDFTDFDHLEEIGKIGTKRVIFFNPDGSDFKDFNLFYPENPSLYFYGPYLFNPHLDIPDGSYGFGTPSSYSNFHPCARADNDEKEEYHNDQNYHAREINVYDDHFCSQFYETEFFEQGSFSFQTQLNFDSNGRKRQGLAYGSTGARREQGGSQRDEASYYDSISSSSRMESYAYNTPHQDSSSENSKAVSVTYAQADTSAIQQNLEQSKAQQNLSSENNNLLFLLLLVSALVLIVFIMIMRR